MKGKDNKTCLKLLQKYADSHELLQQENKMLRHLLEDYEKNIKINKEIISNLMIEQSRISTAAIDYNDTNISCNLSNSKNNSNTMSNTLHNVSHNSGKRSVSCVKEKELSNLQVIGSLTEENKNLSKIVNETLKEMETLRRRLYVSESVAIDRTSEITKEHENLKNKIFVLENLILKRDNQLNNYKEKYERLADAENRLYIEKEVLVTDPAISLAAIHEELIMYKNSYVNLSNYCNSIKSSLFTYEKANNRIMDENTNLKLYIREKNRENYAQNMLLKSEITRRTYNTDNARDRDGNPQSKPSTCNNEKLITDNYGADLTNYNGKAFLETLSKRHRSGSNNKQSSNNVPTLEKGTKNEDKKLNVSSRSAIETNEIRQGSILTKVIPIYADDWCEVIKQAGLSLGEVLSLKDYKGNNLVLKISEAFEFFNQIISDKDVHIDLLLAENEKLNTDIMGLMNEIDTLKKKSKISAVDMDNLDIHSPFNHLQKERVSVVDSINNMKEKLYSSKSKKGDNQFKQKKQEVQSEKSVQQVLPDKSATYKRQGRKKEGGIPKSKVIDDKIQEFKLQFKNKLSSKSKMKDKAQDNNEQKTEVPTSKTDIAIKQDNSFESFNSDEIKAQMFKGGDDAESIQDMNNLKKFLDIK